MGDFDCCAWVWGESISGSKPAMPPSASVSLWAHLFGQDWIRWLPGFIPDSIQDFPVIFVNLFQHTDTPISDIRRVHPSAKIIAMPDPPLETVLLNDGWGRRILSEAAQADLIGGRTVYDCNVYGALLNKPTTWLPSPIGEMDWFAQWRNVEKGDYVVSLDSPLDPEITACNVASLALIQRRYGLRVMYAKAREMTREYARLAGLQCEFHDLIPFTEFVEMIARARLSVNICTRHSMNRHSLVCAAVGTPNVGSAWTEGAGHHMVDPFCPKAALFAARRVLEDAKSYELVRQEGFETVEALYGFDASRQRVREIMERLL